MYKKTPQGQIIRIADGAAIPADDSNLDYQEFMAWQTAGGKFVVDLDDARNAQIRVLTEAYNAAVQRTVTFNAATFQADFASQSLISSRLACGSVPIGFFWLDSNNVAVPMTFAELQGLGAVILAQAQDAFSKLQALKSQVRSEKKVDKIQAISW